MQPEPTASEKDLREAEKLADKISMRLGIMKAGGKEFIAWDDGGIQFAAQLILAEKAAARAEARRDALEEAKINPSMLLTDEQISAMDKAFMTEEGVSDTENVFEVATGWDMNNLLWMGYKLNAILRALDRRPA